MIRRISLFLKKHINYRWKYIGSDLQGNYYFESKDPIGSFYKRKVESQTTQPFEYSSNSLPVQWRAWLSHTRSDAPSIQELEEAQEASKKLQERISRLSAEKLLSDKVHSSQGNEFTPQSWSKIPKAVKSVEVQSSLSMTLNEVPLNLVKLQKLCLWVRIPHSHRLIVWKVLLQICSTYSWNIQVQEEEALDIITTLGRLYDLNQDELLVKAILLQITVAKDPFQLSKALDDTPQHLLYMARAFLGITGQVNLAFLLFRGFIQRKSINVDKQVQDLIELVKIHDLSMYQVLLERKLDKFRMWFMTFYASVLPVPTIEGIWDIVIAGQDSVLGYVGLSCLLSVKKKILTFDQSDFDQLIDTISNYIDADAVANTAVNLWERPILDRMNKDEIRTLPK